MVTEVSGMSNAKWVVTQALSLSLYHFLVTEPVAWRKQPANWAVSGESWLWFQFSPSVAIVYWFTGEE